MFINVSVTDASGISTVIAEIDAITNITLTLSGGYYTGSATMVDGSHSMRIYANDTFGNMNSSVVVYFNVSVPRLANSPWPMFMHDVNHTGRSPYAGHGEVDVKWSYTTTTGYGIKTSPSIGADGTIYVGSEDKKLYAFYPNGTLKWNFTAGYYIRTVPAIASDGTIYFGSEDNKLYALYPNGTEKWNFSCSDDIDSSPAIGSDGTVYFGCDDDYLYAFYPNGTQKWAFKTSGGIRESSPAVSSDGVIYIVSDSTSGGRVYAIYPNGTQKWYFDLGNNRQSVAVAEDGTVYVAASDSSGYSTLYALYPENGSVKWSYTDPNEDYDVYTTPTIASDGTVYISLGETFYAFYPNGTVKWNYSLDNTDSSPVVDKNGNIYVGIYVGTGNGRLYSFYPNGTLRFIFTATGEQFSRRQSVAIASDGTIYISSSPSTWPAYKGKFYALTDLTPPRVSVISPQNTVYPTPTITINVSAYDPSGVDTVIAQIDGTNNVTLTPSGGYYTGTAQALSDGSHSIRIYANDTFGNMNSSIVQTFTIDVTPPVIDYISPTQLDYANLSQDWVYVNVSVSDAISAIDTCILEFNSTDNYTMTFVNTSSDNKTGYCWFNVTGLNEGSHNYSVYVNDTSGNLNKTTLRHITLDVTPPSLILNQPVNNANISSTTIAFNFTATDNIDKAISYTLYIDGVANQTGSASNGSLTTVIVVGLAEGTHTWNVSVTDDAGNTFASIVQTFIIDVTPPLVTIISPENKTYGYSNILINVSASDASGISTVIAEINGSVNITLQQSGSYWNTTYAFSDGSNTVKVYANDTLGNINSTEVSFTVDTTPPSITFVAPTPANASIIDENWFYVNITSNEALSSAWIEISGNNITMQGSGSNWFKNITGLSEGSYSFRVWANDSIGNTNKTKLREVTIVKLASSNSSNITANTSGIIINESDVVIEANANTSNASINLSAYVASFAIAAEELNKTTSLGKADKGIKFLEINATVVQNISNITIKLYYTPQEIAGIDPSTVALYYWNGSVWLNTMDYIIINKTMPNGPFVFEAGRNLAQRYVYAVVNHTSVWGIGGSIITTTTTAPAAGAYSPEVTILANSIDLNLAKEFIDYLEKEGIEVYIVDKNNFSSYNKKLYLIILGGHEAYEGVGEVVSKILSEEEKSKIKQGKAMIKKKGVYRVGQAVYILAGKDREATKQAWKENKEEVARVIKYNWG